MTNIMQAVQWLKDGKKVRRNKWVQGGYIFLGEHNLVWSAWRLLDIAEFRALCIDDIEALDWEICDYKTKTICKTSTKVITEDRKVERIKLTPSALQ